MWKWEAAGAQGSWARVSQGRAGGACPCGGRGSSGKVVEGAAGCGRVAGEREKPGGREKTGGGRSSCMTPRGCPIFIGILGEPLRGKEGRQVFSIERENILEGEAHGT